MLKPDFPSSGKAIGIAIVAVVAVAILAGTGLLPMLIAPVTYVTNLVKSKVSGTTPTA
jgi:hypothetical protein